MTKRRHKSHAPAGVNQLLGKSLVKGRKQGAEFDGSIHLQKNFPGETSGLNSRTHESDLQEFLCNAELANSVFEAEKSEIKIIESSANHIFYQEHIESRNLEELYGQFGNLLKIPRKPKPGTYNNANELKELEYAEFLKWRQTLGKLTEGSGIVLTPFERNVEVWRQLWRVVERSHVVVQIVDARNPLLFRNIDLEEYVKEVDPNKQNVLLINKADLLTTEQIQCWQKYFGTKNINAVFWSAKSEVFIAKDIVKLAKSTNGDSADESGSETIDEEEDRSSSESTEGATIGDNFAIETDGNSKIASTNCDANKTSYGKESSNSAFIASPSKLLSILRCVAIDAFPEIHQNQNAGVFTIGMVGYPNVGKSSTINRLFGDKKVTVSATPGKTKHFQTLIVDEQMVLCDCPGLVMPSFGLSNSEMLINGILPIAHMREYFSPVQLICSRIPHDILQQKYSILLPSERPLQIQAHDLLTAIAFLKGFMSPSGIPDCSRAARLVLSDIVEGKLKWCAAPPAIPQELFDEWTFKNFPSTRPYQKHKEGSSEVASTLLKQLEQRQLLLDDGGRGKWNGKAKQERVDRDFFSVMQLRSGEGVAHIRGGISRMDLVEKEGAEKGGKGGKKHFNRNKREKLRRIFGAPSC